MALPAASTVRAVTKLTFVVLDGGDGTDTLSITNASLTTLAGLSISAIGTLNGRISVERVTISDDLDQTTFDMGRLDDINYITLATGISGNETLSGLAAGTTIVLQHAGTETLTATLASSSGSADSLNLVTEAAANRSRRTGSSVVVL